MTNCVICGREAVDDNLCRYHLEALNNLRIAYDGWKTATGLEWESYLEKLVLIEETGRWVIDVIEHIKQRNDLSVEM
jgi:DNA topoisomerase-1